MSWCFVLPTVQCCASWCSIQRTSKQTLLETPSTALLVGNLRAVRGLRGTVSDLQPICCNFQWSHDPTKHFCLHSLPCNCNYLQSIFKLANHIVCDTRPLESLLISCWQSYSHKVVCGSLCRILTNTWLDWYCSFTRWPIQVRCNSRCADHLFFSHLLICVMNSQKYWEMYNSLGARWYIGCVSEVQSPTYVLFLFSSCYMQALRYVI